MDKGHRTHMLATGSDLCANRRPRTLPRRLCGTSRTSRSRRRWTPGGAAPIILTPSNGATLNTSTNPRVFATSNAMQISFVLEVIRQLNPNSVLDIGCGSGKYGVLMREYLPNAHLDGIEGFAAYITDIHRATYDHIYEANAMEFVPKLDHRYDLAMMIDMFEHLTLDQGAQILQDLSQRTEH